MKIVKSFAWEENFPPVFSHTSISYVKRCGGFMQAKHGDMQAAKRIVNKCIKPERIIEIKMKYPDAVLLPVITANKLPEALAQKIGLRIHVGIEKIQSLNRKKMSRIERLLHKPCFMGSIIKGEKYILVDDVVSLGGTLAALRKFVLKHGGTVCAAAVLAHSANSRVLAPKCDYLRKMGKKFTGIGNLLKKYSIINDLRELTYPEVKYLLRFKEINNIENAIKKIDTNDKAVSA